MDLVPSQAPPISAPPPTLILFFENSAGRESQDLRPGFLRPDRKDLERAYDRRSPSQSLSRPGETLRDSEDHFCSVRGERRLLTAPGDARTSRAHLKT